MFTHQQDKSTMSEREKSKNIDKKVREKQNEPKPAEQPFEDGPSSNLKDMAEPVKKYTSTEEDSNYTDNIAFADNLSSLIDMGFDEINAREGLKYCKNDLQMTLNHMLCIGVSDNTPRIATSLITSGHQGKDITVIHCMLSQYDASDDRNDFASMGRSSCSCIALFGAASFFANCRTRNSVGGCIVKETVTPDFLRNSVLVGVDIYSECYAKVKEADFRMRQQSTSCASPGNQGSGVSEHFSPEQLLELVSWFSSDLQQIGEIRQGFALNFVEQDLSINSSCSADIPYSFHAQLESCRNDVKAKASEWMAVVITKTPETVLVLLPPLTSLCSSSLPNKNYVLIDSHPRPQFSALGAYAILHPSLESLVHSLSIIFPTTDLGPDVSEVIAMMYNSFDLYSFQSKNS